MHNSLKASLLITVCFLCACSKNGGIPIKTENVSENNDAYTINCESVEIEHNSDGGKLLNDTFKNELDEWIETFTSQALQIKVPGSSPPCLQVRHIVKNNNGKLLSIITEKYVYLSGLHGNTWVTAKNFDTQQDNILKLGDLFSDKEYPVILNLRMEELIKNNPKTYHDLWEKPIIDGNREDKFYLDGKNLVIFYEPYELSYYARGVVEFSIPIEKIRGYIKAEYLPS